LQVSKSKLNEKKIFHFKLGNTILIPTKAIMAYIDSQGKVTWAEQKKIHCMYEPCLTDLENTVSLPTIKPDDATKQVECQECQTLCWHTKITEELATDIDYTFFCYMCAISKETGIN